MKNISLEIRPSFIAFMALVVFFADLKSLVLLLTGVIIHEAGHMIAGIFCNMHLEKIKISAVGFEIDYIGQTSYCNDIVVALFGPLLSFFAAFAVKKLFFLSPEDRVYLSGINIVFCLFNMLPVSIMDGGSVLFSFISFFSGPHTALRISRYTDVIFCTGLFLMGLYSVFSFYNPMLIVIALYIYNCCCEKLKSCVKS